MTPNNITIKELRFNLEVDENKDFENVAFNISELTNNYLIDNIQKDFDAIFKSEETISINSIIIDLGEIDLSNKKSIIDSISHILLKKIKTLGFNESKSNESLLIHFLKFGSLPWWASSKEKLNKFINLNSFNKNLRDSLFHTVNTNNSNFSRLLNILNKKNKKKFFRKYLDDKFLYFENTTFFFERLYKNLYGTISIRDRVYFQRELFSSFLKHQNKTDFAFYVVLKKIIYKSNIEWAKVSETLLHKPQKNKNFSEILHFNENLFFSNNIPIKSEISEIGKLKYYILNGSLDTISVIETFSLSTELNRLLTREKKSLKFIFSQLDVYNNPIRLFRISKLLRLNNLFDFISISFEPNNSVFLENFYYYLRYLETKVNIKNVSIFYFISSILTLRNSQQIKSNLFFESLIKIISKKYDLKYDALLYELYFFSTAHKNMGDYQEIIENFYKKNILKDERELEFFMSQLKKSDKKNYLSLLSINQIIQFNLLKKHLIYLNQYLKVNSWTIDTIESFIFNQLSQLNKDSKSSVIVTLEEYSKRNGVKAYKVIIAILMKFYPKLKFPNNESIDLMDYLVFINKPNIINTFSIEEQQFLFKIIESPRIKEKLDLASYEYNLKLISTESYTDLNYLNITKNQDSFIKQKLIYLVQEYQSVFNSAIKSKLNSNQLSQVLKIEIEKNSTNNKFIFYERILKTIADISSIDVSELSIQLLKRLVSKTYFKSQDIEFLNEINDSFFAFNSVLNTSQKNTNYFYELLTKITDRSIKQSVFNNYLLKSKVAILKLNDKNYESLLTNLADNKKNNFFALLNNLLSLLSYQKRIELSAIFKLSAVMIAKTKKLTNEQFILGLLKRINSIDSAIFFKIKKKLSLTDKKFSVSISRHKNDVEIILKLKKELLEKNKNYTLLDLENKNIPQTEINRRKQTIETNYKKEIEILEKDKKLGVNVNKNTVEIILKLKKELLEKNKNYTLLDLENKNIPQTEINRHKQTIETNYKKEIEILEKDEELAARKSKIGMIKKSKDDNIDDTYSINYKEVVTKMSSYFKMPSDKQVNSLSKKDFDYFLSIKKTEKKDLNIGYLNYDLYRSIEDIIKSKDTLLDFLGLYLDDFELLIEFAQTSFSSPIKGRFNSLIKQSSAVLSRTEKELSRLQKETSFAILNHIEFKTLLRVCIFKKIVYVSRYKNIVNVSEFTLDFIESLSKSRKINYKQTVNIGLQIKTKNLVEKQIIKGVTSFFESNNFESVNKIIREEEAFKNTVWFFLKTKKTPFYSTHIELNLQEIMVFIKHRIKRFDAPYIKELLSDSSSATIIIPELNKEVLDIQLDVLKLLDLNNTNSYSIRDFYQTLININHENKIHNTLFFEHILKNTLWKKPSLLYVVEEVFSIFKKQNIKKQDPLAIEFIKRFPSLKIIISPIKKFNEDQKLNLTRYYIQHGAFPEIIKKEKTNFLQLLKEYSIKNKNQLKIILSEFSNMPNISSRFIKISSNTVLNNLILEEIKNKNVELIYLFEKSLNSNFAEETQNEINFYNLLLNNIVAYQIVKQRNLVAVLNNLKTSQPSLYKVIVERAKDLVSSKTITNKNGLIIPYLKSIESNTKISSKVSDEDEDNTLTFSNFIKRLRYFIEFKSFDRTKKSISKDELYHSIILFKSNLILKKQLHTWSKQKSKILTLFKVFPKKEFLTLVDIIHPKQLEYINNFNSILNQLNYRSFQEYLNLNSTEEFTFKILNIWSKYNTIIDSPVELIYSLLEELITHPSIEPKVMIDEFESILPTVNLNQKEIIVFFLKKLLVKPTAIENDNVSSVDVVSLESKDSMYVSNAGLIIIWPFLSTLYNKLELINGKEFIDDYSLQKAILIMHYIVFGDDNLDEPNLILNKILCGASPDYFVDTSIELSDLDKSMGDSLLIAVTKNWDKLNNTSKQGLRDSFLKRNGVIKKKEANYILFVEVKPFDLLLKTIPWNISMIQTSFMDIRLLVEWKI